MIIRYFRTCHTIRHVITNQITRHVRIVKKRRKFDRTYVFIVSLLHFNLTHSKYVSFNTAVQSYFNGAHASCIRTECGDVVNVITNVPLLIDLIDGN